MAPPYAFAILPVDNFFQEFLPVGDEGPPTTSPGFTAMANATSEKEMHGFFVCLFFPRLPPLLTIGSLDQRDQLSFDQFHGFRRVKHPMC